MYIHDKVLPICPYALRRIRGCNRQLRLFENLPAVLLYIVVLKHFHILKHTYFKANLKIALIMKITCIYGVSCNSIYARL
jgi:hypothetical protein